MPLPTACSSATPPGQSPPRPLPCCVSSTQSLLRNQPVASTTQAPTPNSASAQSAPTLPINGCARTPAPSLPPLNPLCASRPSPLPTPPPTRPSSAISSA